MNPELRKRIGQYKADKLKQDLPQYGDGGKKFAAGLAGFAKNIPLLGQVIDPLVANTDAVQDNPVAYASGNLVGSTANTIAMGIANPMSLASNVPKTISAGLNVGTAVATEKGNLDNAQGLNTASQALTGLGAQAGQLTSMFGNIGGSTGGAIPIAMKNGGSIHIDPAKKGTFKAQATRMDMGVQEAASKILNAPEGTYSPEMRKKANFAKNFAKEDGGYIEEFKDGGKVNKLGVENSLWNNIRANKGSGKEPTKEMLAQERKINKKENGGWLDGYESTITNLPNNMAAWSYQDGGKIKKQNGLFAPLNYKPAINETTVKIKDNRTTNPVTGKPINPNTDLKGGEYDKDLVYRTIQASKMVGVDPYKMLGIGLQETNLGKANSESPFHLTISPKTNSYNYINEERFSKLTPEQRGNTLSALDAALVLQEKMNTMKSKGSSADSLQRYNGTGKIGVNTEKDYHNRTGRSTNKFYGIDVAKEGPIDTKKNPVYGKTILSLAEMLKSNPDLKHMVDTTKINFENGGPMGKSNKKDLIEYNGATHENSPIGGIPIAENGQQLHSGFKSQVPTNTQALVAHGETFDPNQEYIYSHELKPMNTKRTFASISKSIDNKYKNNEDPIAVKSKERELKNLAMQNEEVRLAKEAKSNPLMMAKNGGNLPKYYDGGIKNNLLPFTNPITPVTNTFTNNVNKGIFGTTGLPLEATLANEYANNPININAVDNTPQEMTPEFRPFTTPTIGNNYKLTKENTNPEMNQKFTTGDKFQLAGLAPATIYNTIQALRPAEKFKPLTSSYMDAGLNDMNQNVRFNTNPILMNRNVGINQINQGSTSDGVRRANLQSLYRGTNTQLGEMAEKEALANAQIKQSLGQAKIGVGAQDLAAQERARQYEIQAKQAKQQFGATAASQLGQGLTEFGKSSNQGLSNRIGYDVLKNIAPNFTLTEYNNLVKKGMSDAEIIKYLKA